MFVREIAGRCSTSLSEIAGTGSSVLSSDVAEGTLATRSMSGNWAKRPHLGRRVLPALSHGCSTWGHFLTSMVGGFFFCEAAHDGPLRSLIVGRLPCGSRRRNSHCMVRWVGRHAGRQKYPE